MIEESRNEIIHSFIYQENIKTKKGKYVEFS